MKIKDMCQTIESYLGLEGTRVPEVKEDREYVKSRNKTAEGAISRGENGKFCINVCDKENISGLAEEITHIMDLETSEEYVKANRKPMSILQNVEDKFYNYVLMEALGFYGSKLINPSQKPCDIRPDVKYHIETKDWESLRNDFRSKPNNDVVKLWHEIGYDLGQKVFHYLERTGDQKPGIDLLMKNRLEEKPFEVYQRLLTQVT